LHFRKEGRRKIGRFKTISGSSPAEGKRTEMALKRRISEKNSKRGATRGDPVNSFWGGGISHGLKKKKTISHERTEPDQGSVNDRWGKKKRSTERKTPIAGIFGRSGLVTKNLPTSNRTALQEKGKKGPAAIEQVRGKDLQNAQADDAKLEPENQRRRRSSRCEREKQKKRV